MLNQSIKLELRNLTHHIISKHHDVLKFSVQHYHNGPINISQSNLAHVVEASEPVRHVLQRVSIRLDRYR